jgi:lipopolysaccharide/colanic/teichoic acid biosynthesis glycosyltransferase
MKRAFDVLVSLLGLAFSWPALALIGLALLLTSGSAVFFCQERIGLNGRPFKVVKFRTMRPLEGAAAGSFEPGSRARVTPFGRLLRAWKIDELPQLWNVLKGEMSFVGPRPEIRKWVDVYPERWRGVLSVKPGITDPASIQYRDEEEILAASPDPETTYRDVILPHKLDLYEDYIGHKTYLGDLWIIMETLAKIAKK